MDYQKIVALCLLCLLGCDVIVGRPMKRHRRSPPALISADAPSDDALVQATDEISALPSDDLEIGKYHKKSLPEIIVLIFETENC